jgi:phosphatidylinositol glycan class N
LFTIGIPQAESFSYPAEQEDFSASNLSELDTWVFDEVAQFLASSSKDEKLFQSLHGDKVVLFLHLLVGELLSLSIHSVGLCCILF